MLFLELQKDYCFDKTIVLETTRLVVSKHRAAFENQSAPILQNHSIYPILQKILYLQTGPIG